MSGLIWSGIGQGIIGAGQAIGGAMMKDTEYQRQLEAESHKEENYIRRMEEAQRIKDDAAEKKAEELQQRVIKETAAAQETAKDIPSARMARELKSVQGQIAGDSPSMSEAEIQQLIKDNPQYKKIYEDAGYVTKKNESLERTEGAIAAAMAAGSSSTTILNLQKQRTAVLDEIRQDFKERQETARADRFETQTEQTGQRIDILAKNSATQAKNSETMAKNAITAETRANREGSTRNTRETTADLQRQVDSAKDALAEKLGVSAKELYPEIQRLEKRAASDSKSPASIKAQATLDDLQENRDQLKAARSKLDQWTAKVAKEETPPAAETAPPKPNIANIQGAPAGSVVGNYTSRGWEIKDKNGVIRGYVGK
jgi:predicted RNase H-related nuclease YkuK (DUF458 family)